MKKILLIVTLAGAALGAFYWHNGTFPALPYQVLFEKSDGMSRADIIQKKLAIVSEKRRKIKMAEERFTQLTMPVTERKKAVAIVDGAERVSMMSRIAKDPELLSLSQDIQRLDKEQKELLFVLKNKN
jgi:hypothetical protein